MYTPSLDEMKRLVEAGTGNLVPVYRQLPADLETPVSVYLKLRGHGPSFLLESVEGGEQLGRYSFLGTDPEMTLITRDRQAVLRDNGIIASQPLDGRDPLDVIRDILSRTRPIILPGLPRFFGGAVGYIGYDTVRFFERLPATAEDDLGLPDTVFLFTDTLIVFDHVKHRLLVIANAHVEGDAEGAYQAATAKIEGLVARLRQPLPLPYPPGPASDPRLTSNMPPQRFEAMVREAKEYIAAGDIFQVVLSQRLQRRTAADPFAIYRALRMINPSPYMFYLNLGPVAGERPLHLIGSSPEMLVRLEDRVAELRPIAGTRPRGHTPEEDAALAAELLDDPKERAEHVMLVDLGRNDLGRVCAYGSVHVPELMVIERYSHVMHIVSSVKGQLNGRHDAFDLLRATFPAGTVSGAPKVRAMEIIEELEGVRRGPYAGAVGYFGYGGTMDTCITIRTIIMHGDTAYVQAGAGIVADSDPAREYEETMNKAKALAEAISVAERG
ncbi:MAG: anthranilate synthase component I [Anaerolineae bacterium]